MEKQEIRPAGAKPMTLPASLGIRVGDLIFLSGSIGMDSQGNVAGPDIRSQTRQAIENIKERLATVGSSLEKVVKITIFLTDITDFPAMNEVYREYFTGEALPARSTVGIVTLARPGMKIEMETVAIV